MNTRSLDDFLKMTTGPGNEPMLDFYWYCSSLPGHNPMYVESISLPFPSFAIKEGLFGAGSFSYYPGFVSISAFDMVFYEDSRLSTIKWLKAWFDRIRNPSDGSFYLPSYYKENIEIALKNTNGTVFARAVLENVWPTEKGNWDLKYAGTGERLTVHQNFSVDNMKIDFI